MQDRKCRRDLCRYGLKSELARNDEDRLPSTLVLCIEPRGITDDRLARREVEMKLWARIGCLPTSDDGISS